MWEVRRALVIARVKLDRVRQLGHPRGPVLWGHRTGLDWQIGSAQDRRYVARAKLIAARYRRNRELHAAMAQFSRNMEATVQAIGRAFVPVVRDAQRSIEAFGRAYRRSLEKQGLIPPEV